MTKSLPRLATRFLLHFLFLTMAGYLSLWGQTTAPGAVTVSPAAATVVGGGRQQFTATVANAVNPAVTWTVNGVVGGNATVGTVSGSGLYQAPAVVVNPTAVRVTAVSQADPSKTASALVTLNSISIAVAPVAVTLVGGAAQQFSPTLSNALNAGVNWTVNGVVGGSATLGTVSASGLYRAPAVVVKPTAVRVTAVSQADPSKTASALVTLNSISIAVAPLAAALNGGATQQFTPTLSNALNAGVNWTVNGVVGGNATLGTVSASGLYQAPAVVVKATAVRVTAVSQADPSKAASALVTLNSISIAVTPVAVTLAGGATQQFSPTVSNALNAGVSWSVNGVAGGNATLGTVSASGLYTAPALIAVQTTVSLTVASQADTSKAAIARITLVPPVKVTLAPGTASVTGGGTRQFTATVINTTNPAVTWAVNGVVGGNATLGTISTAGLYTAPALLTSAVVRVIKATSQADKTKYGSANLSWLPVTVSFTPAAATVVGGGRQQFTATVANAVNPAVTWTVNGVVGGNATVGTVSGSGLYQAPAVVVNPTAVRVTAVSQADPSKTASALVTLNSISIAVAPVAVTLVGGAAQQFSPTLSNALNAGVNWTVNGVVGGSATLGTVSASGLYRAPAVVVKPTAVRVTAVSQADPSKTASALVTLNSISIAVAPLAAALNGGATQQFTPTLSNALNAGVNWTVNGVVGGNATLGTVSASGLYQAPAVVVKATAVRVTAVSQADPSKAASALVTLNSISIAVTPVAVTLAGGATQQFSPTVSNALNAGVSWSVNGVAGGNATLGTVSASGLYTAPALIAVQTTVSLTVASQADTSKAAIARITLAPVTVVASPSSGSLIGGGSQQFTATVANTANRAVTWAVNGVVGGNATLGTISTAGLYKAAAVIPVQSTVTVKAISAADPTKSGSAVLTLLPITVATTPLAATLAGAATQQFTAAVTNTANHAVAWSVNGVVGGNASWGTISTAGLYLAPATISGPAVVTVVARSQADPTKSASAQVTLVPLTVTLSPTSTSLGGGRTQQFTAAVANTAKPAVVWLVNGVVGGNASVGTISTAGLYLAPATIPSPAVVTVAARSQADPTKSASAQVTLVPLTVTISPTSTSLGGGRTQQFTATVQNSSNTTVTWQVNGVVGGSASTGTISTAGLYTAPAAVTAQMVVTVTGVSQADTSKSAAAQVTISPAIITVTVTPPAASLSTGATQRFTVVVLNTTNTAVVWKVNGVVGGNAALGTISTAGLYSAPASLAAQTTVTVAAVSQADTTKSATAQVTITPPPPTTTGNAFYVAATGNDSNLGTLASPWKTISHAASSSAVQPGDTVYVRGGTYSETVTIGMSGSATAGPVTFQNYPGEKPVIDGTGLTPPSDQHGLFNIESRSYVTVSGFELRNYKTSSSSSIPAGVWVTGAGSDIKILNNLVHDIQTSSESQGNAFGIAVYGSQAPASLDRVTIDGNQVYNLRTGGSESVNVDGNVTNFAITNNIIHDNDNIAIDAIGYEGVSSNAAYDIARNGVISDNVIYNISGKTNPGEGNDYDADGIYVDGGTQIVIERNLIHNVDIGIEVASEHQGTVGSYVTVRNNVVYASNVVGISIGGYDSTVGGTDHCTIVNNTLYGNDTQNSGSGEFQVQYYATNNVFKNNIVYATSQGLFINNYTNSESNPVDVDYNLYFSTSGATEFIWNGSAQSSFSSYQSSTGKDAHSQFSNPFFLNLILSTLNLDVLLTSPAINKGINLGTTVEGPLDFAGDARVQGANIDIGAFEH